MNKTLKEKYPVMARGLEDGYITKKQVDEKIAQIEKKKEIENVALVDMDGTIVDYEKGLYRVISPLICPTEHHKFFGNNTAKSAYMKDLSKFVRKTPNFWFNLPKLDRGFVILKELLDAEFKIHILTKGPFSSSNAWTEKVEWCKVNLKEMVGDLGKDYGMSITSDKGLTYGKILFDDYVPYCERWLEWRPRGLVIQIQNDHNKGWKHPNVIQFNGNNLEEIIERIKSCKER